ncbi:hypothetical protein VTO42DRAFT_7420 [Malbranchea cinnamomea]
MRAKRSKKYRKLMHQYEITFGFREPYQVLVDSHFLRAVHSFKMDLIPALERTLQGKVKPFITKCSLAAVMSSSQSNSSESQSRPPHLPPPTVVPLRYCSHNEEDTPIPEADCLLSLINPSPEAKKNKEHYILATADPAPPAEEKKGNNNDKRRQKTAPVPQMRYNLRRDARLVPGVPIIYVKRSVMILEPMSGASESVRENAEREKFKTGVITGKRKREADDGASGVRKAKKAKGPNPLSVKKPKKREPNSKAQKAESDAKTDGIAASKEKTEETPVDVEDQKPKTKRKRRHKSKKSSGEATQPDTSTVVES